MFRAGIVAIALVIETIFVTSSLAAPSKFVTALAGAKPGPHKTFSCFTHLYDDAHLEAHPKQNIKALRILAVVYGKGLDPYATQLRINMDVRGGTERLSTVAECGSAKEADSLKKGVVCPGIGGDVRLVIENKNSIQVTFPQTTELWHAGPPQPNNTVKGAFWDDDKHFRLTRTHLSECVDEAMGDEEKAFLEKDK